MPENLPKGVAMLRDATIEIARTIESIHSDSSLSQEAKLTKVREASLDAGIYRLTQPKDIGGREASNLEQVVVYDELSARNVVHLPGIFGPNGGVLANVGEPLRSTHLLPMLLGEKRMAFGFTEPSEAQVPTRGKISRETVTINGQKSYVTGGASADFINTLVNIEGQGPIMAVVDRETPGVEIKEVFGSIDGSHHAYIEFHNVKIPISHLVGKQGKGMSTAMGQISNIRLILAAQAVGICRWAIEHTKANLAKPSRDGTPLGDKEGVRLRYADMRIKTYAARSLLYRTARLADTEANVVNELIATKVFATETVGEVIDTAIQLAGGRALQSGHPLSELHARVRAWKLTEGANDILRLNLARGDLDLNKGVL